MPRLALLALVAQSMCSACAAGAQCLPYSPHEVELRGRVATSERFGPPNYGENPESDARLQILVLHLDHPISTCADSASEVNSEAIEGVREIQLLVVPGIDLHPLVGQRVVLRGVLARSVLARHFTPIVFTVLGRGRSPKT